MLCDTIVFLFLSLDVSLYLYRCPFTIIIVCWEKNNKWIKSYQRSAERHPCRCHQRIGTPIFRHPRATNPRVFSTPIPLFLGLHDPTRDLSREIAKGQPYQECSVGMLYRTRSVRRNASPYQKSFSDEIKVVRIEDGRRGSHQVLKCLMTRHLSTSCDFFHFLHLRSKHGFRIPLSLPGSRIVRWYDTMRLIWRMVPHELCWTLNAS